MTPLVWYELSNWLLCNSCSKVIVKRRKDAYQTICKNRVKLTLFTPNNGRKLWNVNINDAKQDVITVKR